MAVEDKPFLADWRGMGSDGVVYRLGQDKVAKFEKKRSPLATISYRGKGIKHEYEVAKFLYENGVSVPQPFGVFNLKPPVRECRLFLLRFPAFVMEYIPQSEIDFDERKFVVELIEMERKKAADLGVFLSDIHNGNSLYVHERQRVYLIDFFREQLPTKVKSLW